MTPHQDLALESHLLRNKRADYDHILPTRGHEQACAAIGVDPVAWTAALKHMDGKGRG